MTEVVQVYLRNCELNYKNNVSILEVIIFDISFKIRPRSYLKCDEKRNKENLFKLH